MSVRGSPISGCPLQVFTAHLQGFTGGMDAEEELRNLRGIDAVPALFQMVVFFFLSKAALPSAGPFLALEIGADVMADGNFLFLLVAYMAEALANRVFTLAKRCALDTLTRKRLT